MRFKRRPNEIKPPPRSLVARGAGRLIRDFSSVAWYPCLDGKTVGQLSAGTTAARTISPAPRGGSKMTAPLPPRCYAAGFRGASESLSPQWRQLAKKRERADHGKTVPLPASPGYWCIRGWNRVWKQNGFLPAISSSSLDMEYRDNSGASHFLVSNESIPDEDGKLVWRTFYEDVVYDMWWKLSNSKRFLYYYYYYWEWMISNLIW